MFWGLVGGYQSFEGTCCLHPQVYAKYGGSMLLWNLMVQHIIRCHERDDKNTNFHRFRNLESYTGKKYFCITQSLNYQKVIIIIIIY